MKTLVTTLVLALFGTAAGFAQTSATYRRTVVDEAGAPLDYFNVIVSLPSDSTYLAGEAYFGGKFEMPNPPAEGPKLILIRSLGYEDLYYTEDFAAPTAPDTLVMKQAAVAVDAVTVTGRVPAVSTDRGKTVVRVAGSMLANLPEVADILRRAPGVRMTEGGPTVFGKGTPQIFLDGRESSYAELQMLQPSQILSIEVDSNPSARYDASYSSVIRVRTTRRREGFSGQVANHAYQGRKFINQTAVQLQYATKRWVNYLSYQYNDQTQQNYTTDVDAIHLPSSPLVDTTLSSQLKHSRTHSVLYGSTLDIDERHQLSWQYSGTFGRNNDKGTQHERILQSGILQNMDADLAGHGRLSSHSGNVRYRFAVDSVRTLEVTAAYANSQPRNNSTINRHYVESGLRDMVTIANHPRADVFSAKAEYTTPLWGANLLIGARYGHIDSRTTSFYNDNSTHTLLRSDNVATYATLGRDYTKWGWEAGLRGEFLNDDIVVDGNTLRQGWQNNLFPSVSLYTDGLSEAIDLSLSYTSRINRPSVSLLDPSAAYVNSVVTNYGNPLLLSTVKHNVELGVELWSNLSLTFGADYDINPSIEAGELSEDGQSIIFKPLNIPRSRNYLIDATYDNSWGPFSLTLNGGVEFPHAKIPYLGKTVTMGKPSWYGSINTDIKIAQNTSFTAGFDYYSRNYYLMTVSEPSNILTAGITQYFFDRRLQLSLYGHDLLSAGMADWHDRYGFYETSQRSSYDTRRVRLSVRWLFNNYRARYRQSSNSEEFNRVN
jgi:hypothetical protein